MSVLKLGLTCKIYFILALILPTFCFADLNYKYVRALVLSGMSILSDRHYVAERLNAVNSKIAFVNYLDIIDPDRHLLLYKDVRAMKEYFRNYFEFLRNGHVQDLIDLKKKSQQISIKKYKFLISILNSNNNILPSEEEINSENSNFPINEQQRINLWKRELAREVLDLRKQGYSLKKSFYILKRRYKRLIYEVKLDTNYHSYAGSILDSVTYVLDPHTKYIYKENQDLNSLVRTPRGYLGFSYKLDKQGGLVISEVDTNLLKKISPGDFIIAMLERDNKVIRLDNKPYEFIKNKLQQYTSGTVTLLIKDHISNKNKWVSFESQAVLSDKVTSRIYKYKGSMFAAIRMPIFYEGASLDVRTILTKIPKTVLGLILDLRSNKGGLLEECEYSAGIFLPEVTISSWLSKHKKHHLIKSRNISNRYKYKGPLTVLVDSKTSSCAEILSAALQDYKRAILLGGQTFGKGTLQESVPLEAGDDKDNNSLLVYTKGKIYRANGRSLQKKGVMPDILVENDIDADAVREQDFENALEYDEIMPISDFSNSLIELRNQKFWHSNNNTPDLKILKSLSTCLIKNKMLLKKTNENPICLSEVG